MSGRQPPELQRPDSPSGHRRCEGRSAVLGDAGGREFRFFKVDERHAILVLALPDLATEERISSEIGGPWMLEYIVPLLDGPPEPRSGEVVAGSG
jgi:hypothetical protein